MSEVPFENTRRRSRPMTLVAEHQSEDAPESAPPSPTTTTASSSSSPTAEQVQELLSRAAWRAGVLGALQMMAAVLAARFILLLSVVGAIGLTLVAVEGHDYLPLIAAAGAVLGVVLAVTLNIWMAGRFEMARLGVSYTLFAAAIVLLLGQIAVLWPALRAASISPVVAIRDN